MSKPTSSGLLALIESGEWVIVPKEPTEAMVQAGRHGNAEKGVLSHALVMWMWADMVAAAPSTSGDADGIGQVEPGADR